MSAKKTQHPRFQPLIFFMPWAIKDLLIFIFLYRGVHVHSIFIYIHTQPITYYLLMLCITSIFPTHINRYSLTCACDALTTTGRVFNLVKHFILLHDLKQQHNLPKFPWRFTYNLFHILIIIIIDLIKANICAWFSCGRYWINMFYLEHNRVSGSLLRFCLL